MKDKEKKQKEEYSTFTLESQGFSFTGTSLANIKTAFNSWTQSCTLWGNKSDGTRIVIMKK